MTTGDQATGTILFALTAQGRCSATVISPLFAQGANLAELCLTGSSTVPTIVTESLLSKAVFTQCLSWPIKKELKIKLWKPSKNWSKAGPKASDIITINLIFYQNSVKLKNQNIS